MLERYDLYIAGFYYLLNNTVIEYITIQWESICKYYKKNISTLTIIPKITQYLHVELFYLIAEKGF